MKQGTFYMVFHNGVCRVTQYYSFRFYANGLCEIKSHGMMGQWKVGKIPDGAVIIDSY